MKIYTRKGDGGETSLMGRGRVKKDDPRVAAYGDVDETNACLGLVRATPPEDFDDLLARIQRDLFTIGGALATPAPQRLKTAQKHKLLLPAKRIEALEQAIDDAERHLPPLRAFVLPGGSPKGAALHLARTVCRRAERSVVRLARKAPIAKDIIVYLNRLSDLLFVLSRQANHEAGVGEVRW